MADNGSLDPKIVSLIDAACDGTLPDAQLAELEQLLLGNKAAQRRFALPSAART